MQARHRFCCDPLAEVGYEIRSQTKEAGSRQHDEQRSQSEPIQGRFAPEDENGIHEHLDEKRRGEAEDRQQDCRDECIQDEATVRHDASHNARSTPHIDEAVSENKSVKPALSAVSYRPFPRQFIIALKIRLSMLRDRARSIFTADTERPCIAAISGME